MILNPRFVFVLLAMACVMSGTSEARGDQPNIIWIVADDLGYNDLSCMGQKNFSTPSIDQMAKEGMRFTQFYAGCTVCAPSRACFLTGLHTGHVFQRFNGDVQFREDPLDRSVATFLKEAGYTTAMIGKSGLSCNSTDGDLPGRKGFDFFFGYTSHREAHRYYPRELWRNGEKVKYDANQGQDGEIYSGDEMLRETLQWIEANQSGPFFLHMSLQQPHADSAVPDKYRNMFLGQFDEEPYPEGKHYRPEPCPKATVAGMITYLDESVGQVVKKIKELGIENNTIIMFTSDNGPHFEGGHHPDHFDSNGALRGGKRDLYEGGIRVPLIVWGPGTIPAGSTSDVISAFWDFPATACELAGAALPVETDGISLVPTLTGVGKQKVHDYLYWEFYEQGGKQAVRAGNWKAIRLQVGKDRDGPIELYNLENDLGETSDVSKEFPVVAKQMVELMNQAHTPSDIAKFVDPSKNKKKAKPKRIQGGSVLDRSGWKVLSVTSESLHNGKRIANVLDGDAGTIWHSQWRDAQPKHPHSFVIDLGEVKKVTGVRILNRQDGTNGNVKAFEIYVADDPVFGEPTTSGVLKNTNNEQRIGLPEPVSGRFLKWVSLSECDGKPFASMAEFNLETEDR